MFVLVSAMASVLLEMVLQGDDGLLPLLVMSSASSPHQAQQFLLTSHLLGSFQSPQGPESVSSSRASKWQLMANSRRRRGMGLRCDLLMERASAIPHLQARGSRRSGTFARTTAGHRRPLRRCRTSCSFSTASYRFSRASPTDTLARATARKSSYNARRSARAVSSVPSSVRSHPGTSLPDVTCTTSSRSPRWRLASLEMGLGCQSPLERQPR